MLIVVMRIQTAMRRRIRWKLILPSHPSRTTTTKTTKHRRTRRVINWIGIPKELMMTVIPWWTKTGPLIGSPSKSIRRLSLHPTPGARPLATTKQCIPDPFIIDAACYLHSKDWMHTGWTLLADTANFERDFLMPAPSTNYHGVVHSELRYAIAYAMQNRVLSSISIDGSRVFSFPVTH